ncbi:hypothetical protein FSP39_025432 [Pinctada imbricata]|uniref:SUEL-type lectin domain-containing protein n=1 Tax=Pinctada imbricata TaxID=66713 RepID=A0AA88YGT1_PINIB|nr:hypothetical protein FSP39_025432 [Pinctada imbricata]
MQCPSTTMISIQFSQYGRQLPSYQVCPRGPGQEFPEEEDTNCLATSSLRVLFDLCQNQRKCRVLASTDTFRQDPCPKTPKYLKVLYKCVPSAFINVTVCEGEQLQLNCSKGTRIAVYSALYGRTPTEASRCTDKIQRYADCRSSTAEEEVIARCHGKRRCAIEAQEYVFGNPCPQGIQKYLKVEYACAPRKIFKHMHKIRHKNKKGRRKKGRKTTLPTGETTVSMTTTSSVLNKVTKGPPNMYPAGISLKMIPSRGNLVRKGDLSVNKDKKDSVTGSGGNLDMTLTSVLCPNNSLVTPAPSHVGRGATGLVVDWFNALNFLQENEEKAVLYMMLGVFGGLIFLLIVIIIRLIIRNKQQRRTKLDVTDPVHANAIPPENHIEAPTLSRHDSMDRIEVVRFEPRSTLMRASLLDSNGDRSLNHYYR